MTKEVENLQHISDQRDTFHSLADKRERQYSQFGQQVQQESSIERAVRVGEVMDRTLDRWGKLTERAEELDREITTETERISGLIQRLEELGSRNPIVRTSYELYKAEYDSWLANQATATTQETTQTSSEASIELTSEDGQDKIIFDPQPVEAPKKEKTTAITLTDGQVIETGKIIPAKILKSLMENDANTEQLAILIYGDFKKENRNRTAAHIFYARKLAETKGWTISKRSEGEGKNKITVYGLNKSEVDQAPVVTEEISQETPLASESEILQIPVVPELRHIESANLHKYDESLTVKYVLDHADSASDQMSAEHEQILEDVEYLMKYTLSTNYLTVFTPDELHGLVSKLKNLENKDRESFNEVEGRLIDHLISMDKSSSTRYESPKKSHMQWTTLKKNATRVVSYLSAKYQHQPEKRAYFLDLRDPETNKTPSDLSSLYTFVAFDYAIDIIGQRTISVTDQRKANFIANCETINSWFESVRPLIDSIPSDIKLPMGYDRRQRMVSARWLLCDQVETMNIRLTGNSFEGFNKCYRYDVAGAINLQHRIKHTVEEINNLLANITSEEIVPLEPDNS